VFATLQLKGATLCYTLKKHLIVCSNYQILITGGSCEIRTHGGVTPSAVFKTAAFNHSAKLPHQFAFRLLKITQSGDVFRTVYLNRSKTLPQATLFNLEAASIRSKLLMQENFNFAIK
jgi:hypothetical protein